MSLSFHLSVYRLLRDVVESAVLPSLLSPLFIIIWELVEPGIGLLDDWTPKSWTNLGNFVQSLDYFEQSLDFAS